MNLGLDGKVALVTGGSEGIGKATAARLAAEGASVAICARRKDVLESAAEEIRAAGGGRDVLAVPCDVRQDAHIRALFDRIGDTYGRLDILVNNAGTSAAAPFEDVSDEAWREDFDLKLFGAIRCARLAIPLMKAQGGGRIINVTAVAGKAPGAGTAPTSISRAAGIALTKALSKDHARDNILVNTVCIGLVKSGQIERAWQREAEGNPGLTLDRWYEQRGSAIPIGRVGETEEAANVIVFLASEAASYVTGVAINIDGGASAVV